MIRTFRHIIFISATMLLYVGLYAQAKNRNAVVNIDALIKNMSIEEKAGQMTQIDLGVIAEGEICALKNPQTIDMAKLKEAISRYHIGSILNVGCGSGTISLENWHKILNTIHAENKQHSNNKIPIIYGIDAIHGANYTMGATLCPQQIAQAATWNPELVKRAYEVTAYEVRATGLPWNFSPVLDLGRQPLWSRFFETFGEDVHLAKTMTDVAIKGYQGKSVNDKYKVASCMKHFLGYSMPLSGRDRTPAWISDRELREYFLPTFETAIKAGAKTLMINSGDINGTPVHINHDILTKLLRYELKFTGVAVTDWEDIYKLVNLHRVAKTKKEAVKMAIMAGVDMSMTPNDFEFTNLLIELVKENQIPESRLDVSVRRILQLKKDLGLFENTTINKVDYPKFGSDEFAQVSYSTAAEAITLLKNEKNILPLNKSEKVFVCGASANSMNLLNGAWTNTWQGTDPMWHSSKTKLTIVQALHNNIDYLAYDTSCTVDYVGNMDNIMKQAKDASKLLVCIGETPSTEMVGNINDLSLTPSQVQLVEELSKLKKPIILVCCFNRPRIINAIANKVDAIIYAYQPGNEGGRAIADIIVGKINPSGKLPFTYPASVNNFTHYDRKSTEDLDTDFSMNAYKPQFDFGFGLSYTTFTYSNLQVHEVAGTDKNHFTVRVDVKNEGRIKGKEVVQVYYTDLVASITPSVKKLCAYKKIELMPNAKETISFTLQPEDFSFINKDLKRVVEPGEIEIIVNNLKQVIHVQ